METPRRQDSISPDPDLAPPTAPGNRDGNVVPHEGPGQPAAASDVEDGGVSAGRDPGPELHDAQWLTADDFQTDDATATDGPEVRPPGPGLPESLAWMGGMLGLQIAGGVVAIVVVLAIHLSGNGANGGQASPFTQETLKRIQREYAGTMFGVIQVVTVVGAAAAVALRLGRERRRRLPLTPIPWRHLAVILAAMLPLLFLSAHLNVAATWLWDQFTSVVPALKGMEEVSSSVFVEKMAKRTPFLGLLLTVAVAPAIAEELVFRGAIGRGLIARWGLPAGVLLTSLLFAAMHVFPPQVLALLPLAVFIHVSYIATRSFWAPVLVHFLNNGLAVVALSMMQELPKSAQQLDSPQFSALMLLSSGFCVAMLMVSLWRSRVQFVDGEGSEWTPGYPAVEWPPEELPLYARCRPTELADWAPAAVGLGVFVLGKLLHGALALEGWQV